MPMPVTSTRGLLLTLSLCAAASATALAQSDRTVYLATVGRERTDTIALSTRAATDSLAVCGEAEFGSVALDADDYSFSYRADDGFSGEDRFCARVCAPDGETNCEEVEVVITVLEPGAAVRVDITNVGDQAFLACVDLPFAGPYAQPTVRDVDALFALGGESSDPSCLVLDPVDGGVGTGRVDAIFCSATNRSFCRQVEFVIDQEATCAAELFGTDTLVLAAAPTPYAHCLAGGAPLGDYAVKLNGLAYDPTRAPDCGAAGGPSGPASTQFFYDLRFAPAQAGPTFELDAWRVDGVDRAGTFASLVQLADSMTVWDPGNDWRYEASVPELVASGTAGDPGVLVVTLDAAAGGSAFVRDDRDDAAALGDGAVVELGAVGWHLVELVDRDGACGERQAIYLTPPRTPETDTVDFVVRADADNPGLCVPLEDLYGEAPTSVEIISQPAVGALRTEDFRCFAYEVGEYTGRDTASVVHCSSRLGLCDTTVLVFAVGEGCDSISLASAAFAQTGNCQAGAGFDFFAAPLDRLGDLDVFVDGNTRPIVADSAGFSVVVPVGRRVVTIRDAVRECFADFEVEVECIACAEPLPERLSFELTCGSPAQAVCLPIDPATIADYVVTLDDRPVEGPWEACADGVTLVVDGSRPAQRLLLSHRDNDCTVETDLSYTCRSSVVTYDTLTIGELRSYCVEPRGLLGDPTTGERACEAPDGRLELIATETPLCFDLSAAVAGNERVCYAVCDEAGACDTAIFEITVGYPLWENLAAVDDTLTAIAEREHRWSLTANDSLSSEAFATAIVTPPALGSAQLDPSGQLTYTAPSSACELSDSLVYELCIDTTCRTATVRIDVRCDPVLVYEGFSPNGDGMNDYMMVVGLDELASYRLEVFSRWGTRVFESSDYANDWDGSWDDGDLPDGPHFYVVTYTEDDGSSGVLTGCTYIRR